MRRILLFLAIIPVLFGMLAAIGGEPGPVRADSAIPLYGCPSALNGSPLGGGDGYLGAIAAGQANCVVSTAAALKSALASATPGQIVYVADGATITLASNAQMYSSKIGFHIPAGVTLAGGRGRPGITPGSIQVASGFRSGDWCYLIRCGAEAGVCGLNLYGNQDSTASGYTWTGISCGVETKVHNNEIHGFGYAGVTALPDVTGVQVHHNYIHHCRGAGHGYGVEVDAVTGVISHDDDFHLASALVEGNIIDYTRHCVANQSGRGSYIFRYNYLGPDAAYEAQCDVHGQNDDPGGSPDTMARAGGQYVYCAGENVEIYNNTSVCTNANEFVGVRGFPYGANTILVHHNWLKVTGDPSIIVQWMYRMPGWSYSALDHEGRVITGSGYGPFVQMRSHSNWYGSSAPPTRDSDAAFPDVNSDGAVNAADITSLERVIAELDSPAGGADANGDGAVNVADITYLERFIGGLS